MILCQSWIKTPQPKAAHMRTHSKTQARHRACKLGDTIVIEALSERMLSLALKTKDCLPIILHADDSPTALLRLVIKRLRERADFRVGQSFHLNNSTVANGSDDHGRKRFSVNLVFCPG